MNATKTGAGDPRELTTQGVKTGAATFVIGLNLYIAAIYTNIAVTAAGFVMPGILGVMGAAFMLRYLRNVASLGWLILFLTASLVFGASGDELFSTRLPSWLQMVAALCCAHVLLCAMKYRADAVRTTLFVWLIFITVGVVLESMLPQVQELSDAFRNWAFEGRFVYQSDARDLREYGFVRPKLFAQEPSHVSKAFLVTAAGWFTLAKHRRFAVLLVCTIVVAYFLRSPFVLLAIPLAWFLSRTTTARPLSRVMVGGIPILAMMSIAFTQVFSTRFATIMRGEDFSFFTRYRGPYEVAVQAIEAHPIFGVGIGAKEALWEQTLNSYTAFFDTRRLWDEYLDYFNNAFANSLMFFGVFGAAVFYFLVAKWAGSFGIRAFVSLSVVLLFFQLDGALEGIRMWSSIAVVWGCYVLSRDVAPDTKDVAMRRMSGSASKF